jgi:hypothetical protein
MSLWVLHTSATPFWARRAAFHALVPYFRSFHTIAAPRLPATRDTDQNLTVARAEEAIATQ